MIKGILFDLDGTFADTAPDLADALNRVRQVQGLKPIPLEPIRLQTSNGANALIKLGFEKDQEDPEFEILKQQLLDLYLENIARHTRLFKGIPKLLDKLDERGIEWGIVTNKPKRFTIPLMKELDIFLRTDCIVSGDTTPFSKPHPAPLIHAAKLLNLAPQECIYIGDAERDIKAACNAGMRSLIAMFGYLGPNDEPEEWGADGFIEKPEDTLAYLDYW